METLIAPHFFNDIGPKRALIEAPVDRLDLEWTPRQCPGDVELS
jgi:hypothetical protein